MLDSNSFTDVTFVVEGREIAAHRVVLALLSDHFRAAFSAGMRESFAKLKGSIGEGSNHSNFSDQSSVKIRSKFLEDILLEFIRNPIISGMFNVQHFQ